MDVRFVVAVLAWLFACGSWLGPSPARAACNLIPETVKSFNSTLGATNRPFAAPGESVEVRVRPCDVGSEGIAATAAGNVVTVVFTPTDGGAARHAVVLTADRDCSAITPLLAACSAQLGAGGSATCVAAPPPSSAAPSSGLQVVERDDVRSLRFNFPDTDALIGTPADDVTLAGPVKLAVSARGAALPCGLATQSCSAQTGLFACIDNFYSNDGRCGTGTPLGTFSSFTALPPPNDYQADCFGDSPPCNASATEIRAALDADGNMLMPFAWSGILVSDAGVPVPRLLQSHLKSPLPFSLDDPIFMGSYTPEGGKLPPIFEPQRNPNVNVANMVSLFGSADAPYTILRFARRQGTCSGGGRNTLACSNDTDCPAGSCAVSGQNFDFGTVPYVPSGGALVVQRQSTDGFCQEDAAQLCSADCAADGPCVNYGYEAHIPVPLEGLAASRTARTFSIRESIDGVDRNGDGDTTDTVIVLRNRITGAGQDLGAPPSCGLSGSPAGRAIVRVSDPPFSFPAVAVEDNVVAFLESEVGQKRCVENSDDDFADALLRIVRLGGGETPYGNAPRAVDAAPMIDARPLAVSNGRVFVRSAEAAMAKRSTERVSVGPNGLEADGDSYLPALSADGRFVAFYSAAINLLGPGGDANGFYYDIFVRDRQSGDVELVSVGPAGLQADLPSFSPAISADGRFVAFVSQATNLLGPTGGDTNGALDVFVHDRQTSTTERVNVGPGGLQADGAPIQDFQGPAISADGRFVAFQSNATNLLGPGGDTNGAIDIFVHDRQVGVTERVSGPRALQADQASSSPAISANGRFVAFTSAATNLLGPGGDTNGASDVFVHDRETGITERVSVGPAGRQADNVSAFPSISADGRFVAFASAATNLLGPGRDTNGTYDVFVHDRQIGVTERVSVGLGGLQAKGNSYPPVISADGRFVAFSSTAPDLVGPGGDTNRTWDVFVHDRQTGVTERVSVGPGGLQAESSSRFPAISADGRIVAFRSPATNLLGPRGDTNGWYDIFVHGPDPADPLGIDARLFANGRLTDTVLEAVDASTGAVTTLCPADAVSVTAGAAAFLRPEAPAGSPATPACPKGALNGDADTSDAVVQFWPGSGGVENLGRAATAVSLSSSHLAALVSEAADDTTDYNDDGDTDDTVVQIHPAGAGSWVNTSQAADVVHMAGHFAVFITDEAAQGARSLNGDGDATDRVLQIYDAETSQLVQCAPVLGAKCATGVRQAAEDFVVGEPTVTACGTVQLVAFRTRESAEGVNLNSTANGVVTDDRDLNDDVLQVYDLVSGTLQNTREAVVPCRIPECDPRTPYKVEGGRVRFLTSEADQGNRDLTGEGTIGLALQLYDFCNDVTTTISQAQSDSGDADPLTTQEESVVHVVKAGRCLLDQPAPCDPGNDRCGAGAACSTDTCALGVCDHTSRVCFNDTSTRCTNDSDCHRCAAFGRKCGSAADCARCVVRQPGSCTNNIDCGAGSTCHTALIVVATAINDRDDDGVPDDQENCADTPNTNQADLDLDGVGDACDLQACGNGVVEAPEQCDDLNVNDADGCTRRCQQLTAPMVACHQALGKATRTYFGVRTKALQNCRNALNLGTHLFFDAARTMAVTDPGQCQREYKTASKLATAARRTHEIIANRCSDVLVGALSACSQYVDGLVDATGTTGCLLATEIPAVDTLIDGQYGRRLLSTETAENICQQRIAAVGRAYVKARLAALGACRQSLLRGKPLFLDAANTIALTDPVQCENEVKTAAKLVNVGMALRAAIADPTKCTDALVASLASTCANTVDGLVNATGTGGCLLTGGVTAVDGVIGTIY